MPLKYPKDRTCFRQHPDSRPLRRDTPAGRYVYVRDRSGVIHIVPDLEPHLHPQVLGGGSPALYAGDLTLEADDLVRDLTNLSGTFQFRGKGGLLAVAYAVRELGLTVAPGAVRWFHPTKAQRPLILA